MAYPSLNPRYATVGDAPVQKLLVSWSTRPAA